VGANCAASAICPDGKRQYETESRLNDDMKHHEHLHLLLLGPCTHPAEGPADSLLLHQLAVHQTASWWEPALLNSCKHRWLFD
jgi:hypothetical protein